MYSVRELQCFREATGTYTHGGGNHPRIRLRWSMSLGSNGNEYSMLEAPIQQLGNIYVLRQLRNTRANGKLLASVNDLTYQIKHGGLKLFGVGSFETECVVLAFGFVELLYVGVIENYCFYHSNRLYAPRSATQFILFCN